MDEMGMVFVNGKGKERKKEWMDGRACLVSAVEFELG